MGNETDTRKFAANRTIPDAALRGSLRDFREATGPDFLFRGAGFSEWAALRRENGLWPYSKASSSAPAARCKASSDGGAEISGINFASQDYLNLASHPKVKAAAIAAVESHGVHSAGSAALLGNTNLSLQLEETISRFLDGREIVLYPTGWSAGFAAVQGFVRPQDHVVLDVLAHSCLQEGARAATANIHYHGHLNVQGLERRLSRIRSEDKSNGILVVTESLFSMHSDTPDIGAIKSVCDAYDARLVVDCAHDLGSIGQTGQGHIGLQNALDKVDIVIGSFSKTFASNGGFIAVKSPATAEYLKYCSATWTFSNALSPVQAAVVLAAFDIVSSQEGADRRRRLMDNILRMRREMTKAGLEVLGDPSPIVPVNVGAEGTARLAAQWLTEHGIIANLVEYPAVPQNGARFRIQVMCEHSEDDIAALVRHMRDAIDWAEKTFRRHRETSSTGSNRAAARNAA